MENIMKRPVYCINQMSSFIDQIADSTWFKTGKLQVQHLASAMSLSHILSLQEICEKHWAHLLSGTVDVYLNYDTQDETDVEDGVQFWCVSCFGVWMQRLGVF